jgi:hypothetical protein
MLWRLLAWMAAWPVEWYIRAHRTRLVGQGVPLAPAEKAWLREYFEADLLDTVRIVVRDPLPVAVPPFVSLVRRLGFVFPDLAAAEVSAITFDCVVAAREPMEPATLFHELVHVGQYRVMGVREFARQYVWGFLESGSYGEIPLERDAYALEWRFREGERPFRV